MNTNKERGTGNQERHLSVSIDLPSLLDRVYHRYPSFLVDAVTEHEPGVRLIAVKNVSVNEDFTQGHYPGRPLMPAVLMIEALTQAAAVLLLERHDAPDSSVSPQPNRSG